MNHLGPISGTLASQNFISSAFWQDPANIDQQNNLKQKQKIHTVLVLMILYFTEETRE